MARLALLRLAGPAVARLGRLVPPRPTSGRVARIVLIRPDHLGDVLLASPGAAVLRQALPSAQIDWLVGPWSAEMARRAAGAGHVLTLDFPGFTRRPKRSPLEPYALLVREAARLRALRYDAALVLRADHWWGAVLAALAGIPRRFGYAVAECTPFLTDTLPPPTGPCRHAVRANQALASLAATRLSGRQPSQCLLDPHFSIQPDELAWARAWIGAHVGGPPAERAARAGSWAPGHQPLVAVHPGSGAVLKNWLPERWAELLTVLRERRGARIFLTGGAGDRSVVDAIASHLDPRPPTVVGETSLGQLAALFACSDLVLGCDSGPLHLAAAVGTPTVRLYGPTDVQEFGPWPPGDQHLALATALPCQPCRALVNPPCGARDNPPCLLALDVHAVAIATDRLLDRRLRPAALPAQVVSANAGEPC